MTAGKLRNILGWVAAVLFIAGVFTGQVWKQDHYIKLEREQGAIKAQLARVNSDIANIQLENKKLTNYKRLEKLGREKFNLVYKEIPEFIYPDQQADNGK